MKKTYTKKQIQEAIAYWENSLAESAEDDGAATRKDFMDAFGDRALAEEAKAYASKNSWVGAFALT